ncbi:MAG: hydantoinase/oxoprolinase family protein [Chloroflexota bacterium]
MTPPSQPGTPLSTLLGVDVGGTFTDAVALVGGRLVTSKVVSTAEDPSRGVMAAVKATGASMESVVRFVHGMTVATNALLERTGAKTASITTAGFRDLIEIGRQNRPMLYDLTARRPLALVPPALRFTVEERVVASGDVLHELETASVRKVIDQLTEHSVEAVAVCLLFSFLHPEHERMVRDSIREALPRIHVSLSTDVLPELREYERLATTVVDAYLTPRVSTYLSVLRTRCERERLPDPEIMQSSGGTIDVGVAAQHAASLVLSGPAGGVVGAAYAARRSGYRNIIAFDMGGTSCDVSLVRDGHPETAVDITVAGVPIRLPAADVHTVSAGGGSIAWVDSGGALRVGPISAGAEPGPACYGAGGWQATVTDANVCLGYIADDSQLGGTIRVDAARARAVVEALARTLSMGFSDAAHGIISIANAVMTRAIRSISVERGHDPRDFSLVAFGGAGPMHACATAEELNMETILIPYTAGVLSALGLVVADQRRDYLISYVRAVKKLAPGDLAGGFERLRVLSDRDMPGATVSLAADMRYRGQSHELTIGLKPDLSPAEAATTFEAAYEARFGYTMEGAEIEFVTLRVTATSASSALQRETVVSTGTEAGGQRRVWIDGEWKSVPVWHRSTMGRETRIGGLAIVEFSDATCVVRPGWRGEVDAMGTLVLRRGTC